MLPGAVAINLCRAGLLSTSLRSIAALHTLQSGLDHQHGYARKTAAARTFGPLPKQQAHRCFKDMSTGDSGESDRQDTRTAAEAPSTENDGGDIKGEDIRERKSVLRKRIKVKLKTMSKAAVDAASNAVADKVLGSKQLAESAGGSPTGAISVYLSMPGELGTSAIISELFKRGKKVYIPKVLGPASADMRMFPVESEEEIKSFPLTKWKIPEPAEELVLSREDGVYAGDIDVVVVPAMAFDTGCNRLGHGKGYYDSFFERVNKSRGEKGRPQPVKIGVCFDEQVVESVPTSSTDVPLDFVMTPTRMFARSPGATSASS